MPDFGMSVSEWVLNAGKRSAVRVEVCNCSFVVGEMAGIKMGAAKTESSLSLNDLNRPEVLANPYPLYTQLRNEDPVHWDPRLHTWVVTRYKDVVTVLRDLSADRTPTPELLESIGLSALSPMARVMAKQVLFLDAPSHTRIRSLTSAAFSPRRVQALREHIQEIASHLLDQAEPKGSMDVIADFALPLPAIVTAEMLGVPTSDYPQLKKWTEDFMEILANFQHNPERAARAIKSVEEMSDYFHAAIARLRIQPREGLVHSLMTAEVDGDRLTDDEVVANSIIVMVGGQETTTTLIGNGLLTLLRHPTHLQRLKSDAAMMPLAVEELLRYESPVQQTARLAPHDLELGGRRIRKRQAVVAVLAAANRDPERFADPDSLDLGRQDNRHVAFGWAAHFCLGAALARLEAQIAFQMLLHRFPNMALDSVPPKWRCNLDLRGLESLHVTLGQQEEFSTPRAEGEST
jgi:cytochrome P450